MTLVLLADPSLEVIQRVEAKGERPPGVVLLGARAFSYAYQEKPGTFCYREATVMTVEHGKAKG